MISKKSTVKKLIALGALVVLFAVLTLLTSNVAVCEFFATTFSRAWIAVFGRVFGVLPFSAYELFLVAAIVLAIVFVVYLFVFLAKKKWNRLVSMLLIAGITVFTFLNVYTVSASFAYNREALPDEIYAEYSSDNLTFEEAIALADRVIDGANKAYLSTEHDSDGNIAYPYSDRQLSDLLAAEYAKLNNPYFSKYTPRAKRIVNKTIMSEMHIVGVTFAPFGEVNVNGNENNLYLPHTLAHEMAHAKGVMREYQADIVASYVLISSDDDYLRYGALAQCLGSALSIVSSYPDSNEAYAELKSKINTGIYKEISNYHEFYAKFSHLDELGEWFNDLYLKLQKQEDGTGSYVKPPVTEGTGEVDGSGNEIIYVVSFSGMQNLLINLYKQGKL